MENERWNDHSEECDIRRRYTGELKPEDYCLFAQEIPEKHDERCGQCAAILHAFVDAQKERKGSN